MELILALLVILAASFVMVNAVKWFIASVTNISQYFKISGYTISFLLVSIATSFPELVVGINSAIKNRPVLAYGNTLGSNIALMTIVVALAAFIGSGVKTKHIIKSKDIYFSTALALIAVALALDGNITRWNGILLLVGYALYSFTFIKRASVTERISATIENINLYKEGLIFVLSMALLIASSEAIVRSAIRVSSVLDVSLGFIGLTITAIGTSLPEIAYSIALIKKKEDDEILGNVVGSVAANSAVVLGITAVIKPIILNNGGISVTTYMFSVITALLFLAFAKSKEKLDKFEAVILLIIYAGFFVAEYMIGHH